MTTTPSPLASPTPWDLVADEYDREARPLFDKFAASALELVKPPPGGRVVDVACGSGALTLQAAATTGRVEAIDFSQEMVARLHRRLDQQRVANVRVHIGDGQALPFVDDFFDAAFSMFGLMFFPDRDAGYRELLRVLTPGGRALVSSWHSFANIEFFVKAFAAIAEADPTPAPTPSPFPLATAEDHLREMTAAGFTDVRVESITHSHEAASPSEYWDVMQRTNAPLVLKRKKMGDEAWKPIAEHVRAAVTAAFGTGPITLRFPAWLGIGAKPR